MATTRFPNGITTAAKKDPFGDFILPDTTTAHIYSEDFDYHLSSIAWTFETIGLPTDALTDGDGGRLLLTNTAGANDLIFLFKIGESFTFDVGKKVWLDCLFQVNDGLQGNIAIGLQATNAAPLNPDDGVFFFSAFGSRDLRIVVEKDNVATSTLMLAELEDNTDVRLSFFYNGKDKILAYVNGVFACSSSTENLPDDENLAVMFGVQNNEAVSKTMTTDYLYVAKER